MIVAKHTRSSSPKAMVYVILCTNVYKGTCRAAFKQVCLADPANHGKWRLSRDLIPLHCMNENGATIMPNDEYLRLMRELDAEKAKYPHLYDSVPDGK